MSTRGVTRRRIGAAAPVSIGPGARCGGHMRFAHAVAHRYAPRRSEWPALALILARRSPHVVLNRVVNVTRVRILHRLALTFLAAFHDGGGGTVSAASRPPRRGRWTPPGMPGSNGRLAPGTQPPFRFRAGRAPEADGPGRTEHGQHRAALVMRLLARQERVAPGGAAADRVASSGGGGLEPVIKVVRRSSPSMAQSATGTPSPDPLRGPAIAPDFARPASIRQFPASRLDNAAHGGERETAAARLDIARLTDQVIDVIDRRIAAQRERMGRP